MKRYYLSVHLLSGEVFDGAPEQISDNQLSTYQDNVSDILHGKNGNIDIDANTRTPGGNRGWVSIPLHAIAYIEYVEVK